MIKKHLLARRNFLKMNNYSIVKKSFFKKRKIVFKFD